MSGPTPPEDNDYYKLRGNHRPTRINPAAAPAASDRRAFIAGGLLLQVLGGAILGAGIGGSSTSAEAIGSVIAWVGAMFLFVGLVAVGVRLGTEELLQVVEQSLGGDSS